MSKKCIVTGAGGQDGHYMCEFLKNLDYEIYPVYNQSCDRFNDNWIVGDISNEHLFNGILNRVKPDEIYNFGGNSNNLEAFNEPFELLDSNTRPVITILDYIKNNPKTKFFQASSSLIFGAESDSGIQNTNTLMKPTTPYGASKLYAYNMIETYKKHYGVFAVNGILYNHESIRRKEHFVFPKIVKGAIECKIGNKRRLTLGNLSTRRDWTHAKDIVRGAYLSLQHKEPKNWIFCRGINYSINEIVERVFYKLGLNWENYIEIDSNFDSSKQENNFIGDPAETNVQLNWKSEITVEEIINELIEYYEKLLTS